MKGRIKVLQLTVGLGWGGAEKLMAGIATGLPAERYDCHVVSLKGDGPIGAHLRKAGIKVVSLGGGLPWRVFQRLRKHVAREVPDVVHSHLLKANLLGALVPGPHKLFWHFHNTSEQTSFFWRFFERRLIQRSSGVIAVSEAVGRDISLRVPSIAGRLHIVPNGIDPARFSILSPNERSGERKKWGLLPEASVIGYVGRIEEKTKKLTHLIEAFAHVMRRSRLAVVLLIVGDGPDRKMLEAFVRGKGLSGAVLFIEAQQNVEKIYPLLDVYVQSSVSEGFGLSIVEAMASGIPVVATRTGGIPEVVAHEETGILVPPGNPLVLAKAVENLLSETHSARAMGNSGRQRVEKRFDIRGALEKIENLYETTHSF